jgi:hypothetical protein
VPHSAATSASTSVAEATSSQESFGFTPPRAPARPNPFDRPSDLGILTDISCTVTIYIMPKGHNVAFNRPRSKQAGWQV